MKLMTKIFLIILPFMIMLSILFSYSAYINQKKLLQDTVDEKLYSIAVMAEKTLPANYHDGVFNSDFWTEEEYDIIVDRNNKLCGDLGLKYLWSLLEVDGDLVFTSSTSPDHNVNMDKHAHFFEKHTNPEVYENVLATGKVQYQTNITDKWGEIRAVLVPRFDIHGRKYIFGASIELSYLEHLIKNTMIQFFILSFVFIAVSSIISFILAEISVSPLKKIVEKTSDIADGNLNSSIKPLHEKGTLEEKTLVKSFNKMSSFISEYIQDLYSSRENLKMTLDSIGDGVIIADLDGCIVRMNPVAEKLLGWKSSEAEGKAISYIFRIHNLQTNQIVKNPVYTALETGEVITLERHTVLTSRDDSLYNISDSAAPIRDRDNNITGVILVFRDITDEFKLQDQLLHSQKMDAIGQLAGGIAHDFNNLLGGIYGAVEILKVRVKDEKSLSFITLIAESAEKAAGLTKNLLSFSRKQNIPSTAINIHQLLEGTIGILNTTIDKRIYISHSYNAEKDSVAGDSSQLQSIFLNIGINATHAMSDGGNLHFRTDLVKINNQFCSESSFDLSPGKFIKISIQDTGTGISPENQSRIFDPFFTTKDTGKGTGLGLSVAYATIKQHKGMITVESKINEGTCFNLFLPVIDAVPKNNENQDTMITGEGNILLVDDESVMRDTGKALLESFGYTVFTEINGQEAVKTISKEKDLFNLVILDMNMPEMNGHDCFYEIKEIDKDLPVIISSGFPQKEKISAMKKDGLMGYIQKPFKANELSEIVSRVMKK